MDMAKQERVYLLCKIRVRKRGNGLVGFFKRDDKVSELNYLVNLSHRILKHKLVDAQRCIKLLCSTTIASLAYLEGTRNVSYPARFSLPNADNGCYITASSVVRLLREFITPPPRSVQQAESARFLNKPNRKFHTFGAK